LAFFERWDTEQDKRKAQKEHNAVMAAAARVT